MYQNLNDSASTLILTFQMPHPPLIQALISPVTILEVPSARKQPSYALSFNARLPEVFAASHGDAVKIWALSDSLKQAQMGETALLQQLAAAEDAFEVLRNHAQPGTS